MRIETINYIYNLLREEVKKREAEYETARMQFNEYRSSYLSGETVVDKQDLDRYHRAKEKAYEERSDARCALRNFEENEW